MSEQFILYQDDFGNYEIRYDNKVFHFLWELAPILNKQQATIDKLQKYNDVLHDENEQLRKFIELMNMRQKWKLYNYKSDNDE